jgi:hypothetical protein
MTAAQVAGAASHTMVVFPHRRASWPQTSIEKVLLNKAASSFFRGGVIECLSRMKGCELKAAEVIIY